MPEKVIFLDIDGVLATRKSEAEKRTMDPGPLWFLDKDCVAVLKSLVDKTGADLVISSSWREAKTWLKNITTALAVAGWINPPIIGRTPVPEAILRGINIASWLEHNQTKTFVIIDDASDMLPEQFSRFVKTSMVGGLTMVHHDLCVQLLGLK